MLTVSVWPTRQASAADNPPSAETIKDAGRHFQRGVALFNEADYPGALAEFKRAYEIAPNAAVLWNIGQTYFQLRSYALALTTFEKYLNDAGASAEHAKEAQTAVDTLRSRVGKIDVTAPDGAEILIDEEPAGKAPLPPILAAVGKRKIVATKDGKSSPPKFVEVAAGETIKAEIKLDASSDAPQVASGQPSTSDKPASSKSNTVPIILWVATGALAAGAVTTGILAMGADSDLADERRAFPSNRQRLDDAADKTQTFALVTDILGASAVVLAGISLYVTLTNSSSSSATAAKKVRLGVGPRSAMIGGTF